MALSDTDIMEITMDGNYLGSQCINVFHYEVHEGGTPVTTTAAQLATVFHDTILQAVLDVVSVNYFCNAIKVKHVLGGSDEFVYEFPSEAGITAGDGLPSFVAYTFKYVRETTLTRHGWKRFAGVSESQVANNTIVAGAVAGFVALADTLFERIESGEADDNYFTPVILSRTEAGVPRETPIFNTVSAVVFKYLGSQNTRKAGRGS